MPPDEAPEVTVLDPVPMPVAISMGTTVKPFNGVPTKFVQVFISTPVGTNCYFFQSEGEADHVADMIKRLAQESRAGLSIVQSFKPHDDGFRPIGG